MVKLKVGQPGLSTISYTNKRTPWVRPSDWLPMPTVLETEDKVVMLVAVYPDSPTYESFQFYSQDINTNAGTTYEVDWGDGTTETVNHAVTISHTYNYNDVGLASAPVTSEGWKQVLITITPTAGSSLRRINFHVSHNDFINISFHNQVKELVISTPNISGNHWYIGGSRNYFMSCKKVTIVKTGAITSAYNTFNLFTDLEEVDFQGMDLSANTNFSGMFSSCYKIEEIPNHFGDTSHGQVFNVMFNACYELLSLPEIDTSGATQMYYFIRDCRRLKEAHLVVPNTTLRCDRLAENCYSLEKVTGSIDLSGITVNIGASYMFGQCYSLREIPFTFDCTSVQYFDAVFSSCINLEKPPNIINTQNVISMANLFNSCYQLAYAPEMDTGNVTNASAMFSACFNLTTVPQYDFSKVTNGRSLFSSCHNMVSYPDFNFSSATDLQQLFYYNRSLIDPPNITTSTSLTNAAYIFGFCQNIRSLPYFETGGVTSFYQAFRQCTRVEELPEFNTSSGTDLSYMFEGMTKLQRLPNLDTSSSTNFNHFASSCISNTYVPIYDLSNATNTYNIFRSHYKLRKIPAIAFPNTITNATDMFRDSISLERIEATGIAETFSVYNCNISPENLEYLFSNLGTVSGETINIGLNPGTATCDRTIATAKGWTVSG